MDQFDALVSGAPTDKETQLAIAQQLRRQAFLGQLGQASGDEQLSGVGKALQQQAMSGAQDISSERAKQAAAAQAQAFHQDEMTHQNATLAQSVKAEQDRIAMEKAQMGQSAGQFQQTLASTDALRKAQIAKDEADTAKEAKLAGDGKPLPAGVTKILDTKRDVLDDINNSVANFKPEYAGAGQGIKNWVGSHSALMPFDVDPNTKAGANWWQQYGRNFTLDEMHAKFGARVSPTEMAVFEKYHISPGMDADTIKNNITQIQTALAKHFGNSIDVQDAPGIYSKAELNAYRTSLPGAAPPAAAPAVAAPGAPPAAAAAAPVTHTPESVMAEAQARINARKAQQPAPPTSMNFPQAATAPMPGPQNVNSMLQGLPMGQMG